MNTLIQAGQSTQAGGQPGCPCHDMIDCPDQATVAITVVELARLGELLSDVDEFLRGGNGVAERLAAFYATDRGHRHPRFAAANLIDAVGFAATGAAGLLTDTGRDEGDQR